MMLAGIGCKTEAPAEETVTEEAPAEETVTETEPVHLVFMLGAPIDVAIKPTLDKFVELHPNVTYEIQTKEVQILLDMTPANIEAGEYFDIRNGWGGVANWGPNFWTDNYCFDLTPYYEKYGWEEMLVPAALNFRYPNTDKWFGICIGGTGIMNVLYEKTIFSDLGLDAPASPVSWEDFKIYGDKVKDAGYIALATGGANPYLCHEFFQTFIARLVPIDVYNQYLFSSLPGRDINVKWTDPVVLEATKYLRELANNYFEKGVLGTEITTARSYLTTTGDAAMYNGFTFELASLNQEIADSGKDIGYFAFPQIKDDVPASIGIDYVPHFFVPPYVKEENVETIMEFFDFLLKPENMLPFEIATGVVPSIKVSKEEMEAAGYTDPLILQIMEDANKYGTLELFDSWLVPEVQKASMNMTQAIIGGTLATDEDIMKELENLEALAVKNREGE